MIDVLKVLFTSQKSGLVIIIVIYKGYTKNEIYTIHEVFETLPYILVKSVISSVRSAIASSNVSPQAISSRISRGLSSTANIPKPNIVSRPGKALCHIDYWSFYKMYDFLCAISIASHSSTHAKATSSSTSSKEILTSKGMFSGIRYILSLYIKCLINADPFVIVKKVNTPTTENQTHSTSTATAKAKGLF